MSVHFLVIMAEDAEWVFENMLFRHRDKLWTTSVIEAALDLGVIVGVREDGRAVVSNRFLLDDVYREFLRNVMQRYVTLSGSTPYEGVDT